MTRSSFRVFDEHGVPRGSARGYTIEIPVALRIGEWTTDGRICLGDDMGTRTPPLPIMLGNQQVSDLPYGTSLPVGVIVDVRLIDETDNAGVRHRYLWCGGYISEDDIERLVGTEDDIRMARSPQWFPGADLDTEAPYEERPGGFAIAHWKLTGVTLHPADTPIAWPDIPPVIIKRRNTPA